MSRPLRLTYPGALYHITARGNRRGDIYLTDCDKAKFNRILGDVVKRCGWVVHAWCQMTNHYHLLVETPRPNLPHGMRQLNGNYAGYFNRVHDRVGHVFQGRYSAINVQRNAYFLEVARYVVLNPVRARIVSDVQAWPWSSYRDVVGIRKSNEWLTMNGLLVSFGKQRTTAIAAYVRFVAAGVQAESPWQALRNGVFLGDEAFVNSLLETIEPTATLEEIPLDQRQVTARSLAEWERVSPDRNKAITDAYLSGAYTLSEIGKHFGLHYSRVSRIIKLTRDEKAKGKT